MSDINIPEPPTRKNHIPFQSILVISFIAITLLPILIIAPTAITNLRNAIIETTQTQQQAELMSFQERLQGNFLLSKVKIESITKSDDILTATENIIFAEPAQKLLQQITNEFQFIKNIFLFDINGELVTSAQEANSVPIKYEALKHIDKLTFTDYQNSYYIFAPLKKVTEGNEQELGLIAAEIDLPTLLTYRMQELKRKESSLIFTSKNQKIAEILGNELQNNDNAFFQKTQLLLDNKVPIEITLLDDKKSKMARANNVTYSAIGLAILSLIIATIFGVILAQKIIKPVKSLTQVADHYAQNDFSILPHDSRIFDFAKLSYAFLVMVSKIREQIQQLHVIIDSLEILSKESEAITSKIRIEELAKQIQESLSKIRRESIQTKVYLEHTLFENVNLPPGFYDALAPKESSLSEEEIAHIAHERSSWVTIHEPKTLRPTGYIQMIPPVPASKLDETLPLLNALSINIANTLENIRFVQHQKDQVRMQAELETAKLVQQNLLPKQTDITIFGYEIAGFATAATECGGDWWGYFVLPDDRLLILLGDVTGHGTPSALVTAVVKGYCDSLILRHNLDITTILTELHAEVRKSNDGTRLMTMFGAILNPKDNTLSYASAGHNPPFIFPNPHSADSVRRLMAIGNRLGFGNPLEAQKGYESKTIPFNPGETLFVYSDGLVEGTNPEGQQLGDKSLRKVLSSLVGMSAKEVRDNVKDFAFKFYNGNPLADDVTFFALKYAEQTV